MDYNTTGTEIKSGTSNKALIFAITLFLICAAAFAFFYYFYVVRPTPAMPTETRALTQEEIDAIIAKEPKISEEEAMSEDEINTILRAESGQTSGTELTDEQLLKIKQAN